MANTKELKGYILRSAFNPSRILLTTFQFCTESYLGAGTGKSAKIYKLKFNAEKAAKRFNCNLEEYWNI